jgi:hypothetical protein
MHVCEEAVCRPCVDCDGTCVVLATNEAHCGACNTPVRFDQRCIDGRPVCAEDATDCGGDCVSLETSSQHCGGCDRPCSATCMTGQCVELVTEQGPIPTSCGALCSAMRQAECVVLPEPVPGMEGAGAGAALYDDGTTSAFYLVATCEETPSSLRDGLPYVGIACFCRAP